MKKVVFVSIDNHERWSCWYPGNTDCVYYSDFLNTEDDVNKFIEQVKADHPDNNFIDDEYNHKYFIKYVVLGYDDNDEKGFETLKSMMRAYHSYDDINKKVMNP